jgi:hypothetical protein
LQRVNAAHLRKQMVRVLRLKGDNRIFQPVMAEVPAAWIGEEAVAIKYRLDRGRAPCRVVLPEYLVKVANQQILDAVRHALFSLVCAQTCAWPPSANNSAPVTKLESSDARNSAALAISCGSATRPRGSSDAI